MLGRLALQWLTQGVAVAVNRQLRPPLRDQIVHRPRPSHARAIQELHKRVGARLWGSNLLADVEGVVAAFSRGAARRHAPGAETPTS